MHKGLTVLMLYPYVLNRIYVILKTDEYVRYKNYRLYQELQIIPMKMSIYFLQLSSEVHDV